MILYTGETFKFKSKIRTGNPKFMFFLVCLTESELSAHQWLDGLPLRPYCCRSTSSKVQFCSNIKQKVCNERTRWNNPRKSRLVLSLKRHMPSMTLLLPLLNVPSMVLLKGKQKSPGRATSRSRSQPLTPGGREKVTQINVCIANKQMHDKHKDQLPLSQARWSKC